MEFYVEYEEMEYFVQLDELKYYGGPMEIFKNFDYDEYEIKVFASANGELSRLKVTELPEPFKENLGGLLHDILPKEKTFVANPYFDELLIFFGNTIFTSQEKLKPIDCSQCGKENLYEKGEKENKTAYVMDIQQKLRSHPNPEWPFKEKLQVQITVSDMETRLNKVDLDNLCKSIFDSLKGIVFEDDRQITFFAADKTSVRGTVAHLVAIRRLENGEKPQFQEFMYGESKLRWHKEYEQKRVQNRSTRFVHF